MHRQQGFTLIELLVVIAIIGILATLVITQLGGATTKARNSSAQSDVTEMAKSVGVFEQDDLASGREIATNGGLYTDLILSNTPILSANATLLTASGTIFAGGTYAATNANLTGNVAAIFAGKTFADATAASVVSTYGTTISKTPSNRYVYGYRGGTATDVTERALTAVPASTYGVCGTIQPTGGASTTIQYFTVSNQGAQPVGATCL